MSTQPKTFITPEQYLDIDREAEFKSEYYDGEMFAMAGAREPHNLIVTNFVIQVGQQLRSKPCRVYSNDMRAQIASNRRYTFPDAIVVCGEPQFLDHRRDTLLNPTLIVEVLSPSNKSFDRILKFAYYRSIPTLLNYLLISSEHMGAELRIKQPDGEWSVQSYKDPQDLIDLPSIGCRLTLADLYEKVDLPSSAE